MIMRVLVRLCDLACTVWSAATWAFPCTLCIGTIPAELGQLHNLQQLSVWNNILSGEIRVTRKLFLDAAIGVVETTSEVLWSFDVVGLCLPGVCGVRFFCSGTEFEPVGTSAGSGLFRTSIRPSPSPSKSHSCFKYDTNRLSAFRSRVTTAGTQRCA